MIHRALVFALVALLACGQEDETASAAAAKGSPTIKVKPATTTLAPSAQALFSATPANTSVTWSVREAGGGSVTAAGLYTAPGSAGVYHVVATAAGGAAGEATVTVASPVTISAPATASTDACRPLQLSATVSGSSDTGVIWTVPDPACGAVTAAGVYTSSRGIGTCQVQAQAHADPAAVALIAVSFTERVLGVVVSPATVALTPGGQAPFAAAVTTTCGTFPAGG